MDPGEQAGSGGFAAASPCYGIDWNEDVLEDVVGVVGVGTGIWS